MASGTRNAVPWAPSILKATTVVTAQGNSVVTLCMQRVTADGKRDLFYNTHIANGGTQMGHSKKDGLHYHERMCKIAKEDLEERERDEE